MSRMPDFVVIGAMKAGTSSLHEQLRLRSGVFMSTPKEPNFFSDDDIHARGLAWYGSLFANALPGQICGESSTHYTKLPTHPRTVERMSAVLPRAKLIYVMRDPIERIISQYIHEWTQREVAGSLVDAVRLHERYAAYSCYARQLRPYMQAYGSQQILLVTFERLSAAPDEEFRRICSFIGDPTPCPPKWSTDLQPQNVSAQRLRRSRLREAALRVPVLRALKDRLPRDLRERLKRPWRISERPRLPDSLRVQLESEIDADLARLSEHVGEPLTCRTWKDVALGEPLRWRKP